MKILIVSRAFYPNNSPRSFRTTELAKELSRQGHEVDVITHRKNEHHSGFEEKYNIRIQDLGKTKWSIFDINKGNKILKLIKRAINRLLLQLFEFPDIQLTFMVKNILRNKKNYDLLISIAVPHTIHWGVALARKKRHKIAGVWVADCGDPYMGNDLDTFKKPFYFKYVEKWWCKKADYIAIPFKGAIDAYYKEFHGKIKVISQGFNFEDSSLYITKYSKNEIPTFAYSGAFIRGVRDPREFINYLLSLKINFKFIIYTNKKELVQDLVEKSNGKIEVRSYIPREELIGVLSKMDFILNINNGNSTQLPSKLIDYSLTGRPILSIDSFNFNKDIVNQFLESNYSNQLIVDNIDEYRIENVCSKFLSISV